MNTNTNNCCGNGGGAFGWGGFGWIINLIIIIIAIEFLTQIFCGCGNNGCC